jgi:hypothetical protein
MTVTVARKDVVGGRRLPFLAKRIRRVHAHAAVGNAPVGRENDCSEDSNEGIMCQYS